MQNEIIPSRTFTLSEIQSDPLPMFPAFPLHTCPDDFREVEVGPYRIRATIKPDYDTRPDHSDCYAENAGKAWSADEWQFVGVVLSIWVDEICLDDHAASVWGVECNFPGGDNLYLSECADDLLPEAIERAEHLRATLAAKLK